MVEQDGFGAMVESLFQFVECTNFNFDDLFAAAVTDSALKRGNDASGQRDVIVLEQDTVGKISDDGFMPATTTRNRNRRGEQIIEIENRPGN